MILIKKISECLLENIGKPVFHAYSTDLYGSWMQDAVSFPDEDEDDPRYAHYPKNSTGFQK